MSSIKLTPVAQPSGGIEKIEPLLLPHLDGLYARRAARLLALAEGHAMADYLQFAACIAGAQLKLLEQMPLPDTATTRPTLSNEHAPLDSTTLPRDRYWQQLLHGLIDVLLTDATPPVRKVLEQLRAHSPEQLETLASALLAGNHAEVGSDRALFLWSALSLYWAQLAARLPLHASAGLGENRQLCPVCAQSPSASVIIGGLRYLHCSLCESRWHMVRIKCSNCEETGKLDYWSLESKDATLKAESCGDCHSYLKVLYLDRDRDLEVVADDLASLALDAEVEREGFARSGLNPFLFPG
ncbi:formate dehydrogenase accessory protein FdhE [Pseudomonas sp. PDM16]|uniref:formate dehydrogenase accessory protein FdhE n=1 Tax=Pseudomonas sp. PDM16 TaxID=2769292 RepID=UPI00177D57BC|nr:formate dehydrogenase accessory protein FdhE [Pseudomonas sp. PDM16]MBD9415746.1 formate dehydrogenase accessory protein FdhE [Pseudomonas sp. PDM16]